MSGRVTAVVLAAGAARRFGGGKLFARIDGRPILQHVLDALGEAGMDDPIVVTGHATAAPGAPIDWRGARRVENPDPDRGLASSLQVGWAEALATEAAPAAVLVVLGDQPRLDPELVRRLVAEPLDPGRPVVVARHADGSRNPVRLEPAAAPLVAAASGDRGLGPLLDAHPGLVRSIDAGARNPDVDTPADLAAVLADEWRGRVEANAAQVERFRETPDGRDFYATVHRTFVADPDRDDDPVLDALTAIARPGDTWLDIGAGAGRYALPLARRVRRVIAVDPSGSMLEALRTAAADHGLANVRAIEGRWPPDAELRAALGPDPVADVALIAHVGYDIAAIEPFISAMGSAARRTCVAVLMEHSPASVAAPFWARVHGEDRVPLPALGELLELLTARGVAPGIARVEAERRRWADRDELLANLRRQLWTAPGSAADDRLLGAVEELAVRADDGTLSIPSAPALGIGIVTWDARESR